jgi:hypothetical protein
MTASSQIQLEFAVKRLHWCLEQPLVCGGQEWAVRVLRALEQLGEAFQKHVHYLESSEGPLEQIAEPGLLPFTAEAKRVGDFRAQCQRLCGRINAVTLQVRNAFLMFPADEASPADLIANARAFRLFGILRSCATDLADALDAQGREEATLLGEKADMGLPGN